MKYLKVYNTDNYNQCYGIHDLQTEVIEDEATASKVADYFAEKFQVEPIIRRTVCSNEEFVVIIKQFDTTRILSHYDKSFGGYVFGIEVIV